MEKFGFLLHPLSIKDVAKKYRIANRVSPKLVARVLKRRPSFILSEVTGVESLTGIQAQGWLVAVPLLPWQILELDEEYVIKKIVKACKVAQKEGAKIVGLGAFTALVGDGGKKVAEKVEIPVTTGNTYTVVTAIEGTLRAAEIMEIDLEQAQLAVVGATGSIGRLCAEILAPKVNEVRLVGREENRLQEVARKVTSENSTQVKVYTNVSEGIRGADIIISVTGSVNSLIYPEDIKPGAVVCDVARPRDVSPRVAEVRDDVMVIDGGIVKVPGKVNFNFDLGLPHGLAEACIAETIILALEKRYESYTLGRNITLSKVKEMENLALKHGFKLAGLRRFERALTPVQIENIRHTARNKG